MERPMTTEQLFSLANAFAVIGWLVLIAGVVLGRPWLRDRLAGIYWPLALSAAYIVAFVLGYGSSGGNFSSLAGVRQLFAGDWTLLAGWIHYLAFDLFVGAWIARETERAGLSRWFLVPVLPMTFLLGPVGFLLFYVFRTGFSGAKS
jgi:hypothetical protein